MADRAAGYIQLRSGTPQRTIARNALNRPEGLDRRITVDSVLTDRTGYPR
jgi:hypothetical protein